ncbi:hypothetical protein [Olsenella profusa]|uniref:DUF2975 domain-containing protein n=1 Tax=Olsenella profusa TaxID=138595 RepID=A0ABS2F2A1_9ACTN|nr:hypothetical protein [Olsenella profusa]MBM6775106.1 hypothetical protein [Olsenella profusa]
MRKSTFIGNFVAWVVVAAVCIAFLAWYHMSDMTVVADVLGDSPLAQLGVVLAAPVLLYAIGVILGLMVLWFKKITLGHAFKLLWRVLGIVGLAVLALAAVPLLGGDAAQAFMWASVIVVYVSVAAPILIMVFGFFYALGCAGTDKSRRGPFAKYLPDDHFE